MNGSEATEYGVWWLTLAFINAGLAQSKGRRGVVWGMLTLMLGPIATAMIVVARPVDVDTDSKEPFNIEHFRRQ